VRIRPEHVINPYRGGGGGDREEQTMDPAPDSTRCKCSAREEKIARTGARPTVPSHARKWELGN